MLQVILGLRTDSATIARNKVVGRIFYFIIIFFK